MLQDELSTSCKTEKYST